MALVKISIPTRDIEAGVHLNRAILIATALVTALLIMGGSLPHCTLCHRQAGETPQGGERCHFRPAN